MGKDQEAYKYFCPICFMYFKGKRRPRFSAPQASVYNLFMRLFAAISRITFWLMSQYLTNRLSLLQKCTNRAAAAIMFAENVL
jgi:hypothetical protein